MKKKKKEECFMKNMQSGKISGCSRGYSASVIFKVSFTLHLFKSQFSCYEKII